MSTPSFAEYAKLTLETVITSSLVLVLAPPLVAIELVVGPLIMTRFERGDTPYLMTEAEEIKAYDPWGDAPEGTEKVELTGWEGQPLWAFKTLNWQNSRPTLMLLHGWPDDATEFAYLLTEINKRGCVNAIALTQRGAHSDTLPDKNGTSAYCMAKDIEAIFIDERSGLSKGHKVHLVGHDWGGYFAAVTIRQFPELFETVTFVCAPYARYALNTALTLPKQSMSSWYMLVFISPLAKFFVLGQYRFWSYVEPLILHSKLDTPVERKARLANAHKQRNGISYLMNCNVAKPYSRKALVYNHDKVVDPKTRNSWLSYYSNNIFTCLFPKIIGYSFIGRLFPANQRMTARINCIDNVPVPSLSIGCAEDRFILPQTVKHAANPNQFPKGVRYVELKDSGHWPSIEEPVKFADLLEAMALSGLKGVDQIDWNVSGDKKYI